MARSICLRQGSKDDYAFALELYLSTMRPYAEELMVWDELKQRDRFAAQWRADEVQILAVDGKDVGWVQVSETSTEIRLLYARGYRHRRINTKALSDDRIFCSATRATLRDHTDRALPVWP
jgi:hypothetical protein